MPTKISKVKPRVSADVQVTSSGGPASQIIEIDKWRDLHAEIVPNSTSIKAVVAEYELDPVRRKRLENARKKIASALEAAAPNKLRTLRLRSGLSQAALASQIGTTQAQIARIESGRQDVQVGTMERLAEALGIDALEAIKAFLDQRRRVSRDV